MIVILKGQDRDDAEVLRSHEGKMTQMSVRTVYDYSSSSFKQILSKALGNMSQRKNTPDDQVGGDQFLIPQRFRHDVNIVCCPWSLSWCS